MPIQKNPVVQKSVGIFYSFEKSAVVIVREMLKEKDKKSEIHLESQGFEKHSIGDVVESLLGAYLPGEMVTNKHESLKDAIGSVTQLDLRDENNIEELKDIFLSFQKDCLVKFDANWKGQKSEFVQAASLAFWGLKFYKRRNHTLFS